MKKVLAILLALLPSEALAQSSVFTTMDTSGMTRNVYLNQSGTNYTIGQVTGTAFNAFILGAASTKSGSTNVLATTNGTLTNGHYVSIDSSGNLVDGGVACCSSGTVASGLTGQLSYYVSSGANVAGLPTGSGVLTALGVAPTGAGSIVLGMSPTIASPTITGAFTATGLVTNADLANASTTVNGVACTLGSTCSVTTALPAFSGDVTSAAGTSVLSVVKVGGVPITTLEQQNVSPKCVADGVTDCLPAFNAAKASFSYSLTGQSGGIIFLGATSGCYYFSATASLTASPGLVISGKEKQNTCVTAGAGNYPVFSSADSYNAPGYLIGVKNMSITCGGKSNTNANGVQFSYTNRGVVENVMFYGCNHAMDMTGQFLTRLLKIDVNGSGSQQSNYCLYANFPTDVNDAYGNNSLITDSNTCQNAATTGYRLVDANGSIFSHDQILGGASNPSTGIDACNQPSATYPQGAAAVCEFMFFDNVQTDTIAGYGWRFRLGSGGAVGPGIVLTNPWAGSSSTAAFDFQGVTDITATDAIIETTGVGVNISNSNNVKFSGHVNGYNAANNGSQSVLFSGTTSNNDIHVSTTTSNPISNSYNGIQETGTYSNNQLWAGRASCGVGLAFGGANIGMTYTTGPATANQCAYEVQGTKVAGQFYIGLSALGSSTGSATITGLPITIGPAVPWGYAGLSSIICTSGCASITGPIIGQATPAGNTVQVLAQGSSGTVNLSNSNFTNTATLVGQFNYEKQ